MALQALLRSGPRSHSTQEEHWVPLSDLMTGLMMMFMLVAVLFMIQVDQDAKRVKSAAEKAEFEANKVKQIALVYDLMRGELYEALRAEFEKSLPIWGAELDTDLTIRFKEPDVLFDTGKDALKEKFRRILDDFFPRYVKILTTDKYRTSIDEVRIEGHTSSFWKGQSADDAYFSNMELSQSRTRTTLRYVLGMPGLSQQQAWLKSHLTANGLSSSKLRLRSDGSENREASQRVEFRVRTNADARIAEIIRATAQ